MCNKDDCCLRSIEADDMFFKMLKVLGWVVSGLSFYFVGSTLFSNAQQLTDLGLTWSMLLALTIGSIAYGVILPVQTMAWGLLLSGCIATEIKWAEVLSVYGRSQIMKYVPSNIFHMVGRQILGRTFGWSQRGIAVASVLEAMLLIVTALFIIIVLGSLIPTNVFSFVPKPLMFLSGVGTLMGSWLLLYYASAIPVLNRLTDGLSLRNLAWSRHVPLAFFLYLAFFVLCGLLLWFLLATFRSTWNWNMVPTIGLAFTAAWLIGYVVPGAPGGLGVREAGLVILLTPFSGEPNAVMASLAMRVITTIGDMLYYLISAITHKQMNLKQWSH
jgi:glycosyltransferase 2 family protein